MCTHYGLIPRRPAGAQVCSRKRDRCTKTSPLNEWTDGQLPSVGLHAGLCSKLQLAHLTCIRTCQYMHGDRRRLAVTGGDMFFSEGSPLLMTLWIGGLRWITAPIANTVRLPRWGPISSPCSDNCHVGLHRVSRCVSRQCGIH